MWDTVDGSDRVPVEVGSLSHYLQGFILPKRLFGISEPSTVYYQFFLIYGMLIGFRYWLHLSILLGATVDPFVVNPFWRCRFGEDESRDFHDLFIQGDLGGRGMLSRKLVWVSKLKVSEGGGWVSKKAQLP